MSDDEEMSLTASGTTGEKVACDDDSSDEGVCSYKPTSKYVYPGKSKRRYQCNECGKSYVTNQGLKRHTMEHTGDYPFKCEQCPKVFAGISEFKKHSLTHTGERPFKCEICQKDFVFAESLENHASVHSDDRPFQCPTPGCPARYKNKSSLDIHNRSCLTGNFKSGIRALVPEEVGGLTYYRPPQLVEKIAKRKKNYGNEIEECPICQTRLKKKSMRFHIQSHTNHPRPIKTFTCAECERVFRSKEHLIRHLATHDDNRPVYKCDLCDKTYMTKETFRNHKKTHAEGGGRTKCPTCGVMCTNLPRHVKYHTLPYFCQHCLQRFARSDALQRHQRSGKEEDVIFECQLCNKSFDSRKCLDYHETTHDDEDESSANETGDSISDSDDEQSFSTDSSYSSSSNEEWQELSTGRAVEFKESFVLIKRADFIESAVQEEFKSVRITRFGRKSSQILYTPIP